MPKNCINCGTPINGEGQNKLFCTDCLQKVTPFFKFIGKSKVPAAKLYELNLDRLKAMGLSELTLKYIEKCCVKLDESRALAKALPKAEQTPTQKEEKTPAKTAETDKETASSILSAAILASKAAENEEKAEVTAPKSDEFSKKAEEVSSKEIKTASEPDENIPTKDEKIAEYGAVSSLTVKEAAKKVTDDIYGDDDIDDIDDIDDEYEDDDVIDEGELSSKKRIVLIIAAAVTAFIIFLSLYLSGLLPSYSPFDPKDSDTDTVTDTDTITDENTDPVETEPVTETDPIETVYVCPHEWKDASCSEPKTCTLCGETEGEPRAHDYVAPTCTMPEFCRYCFSVKGDALGHDWSEATCTEAQTCSVCGETNGAPLDHNFKYNSDKDDNVCTYCKKTQESITGVKACEHEWTDADCDTAKTCTKCGRVDGDALGHDWKDATCSAPKTCSRCSLTEGEPTDHAFKEATCTEASKCSYCGLTDGEPLGHDDNEVWCSRCGEYMIPLSEIGTTYDNPSGLSVTIQSIEALPSDTGTIYYVKYTVRNNSPDSMLEGAFKLFLEEGGGIDPPGVAYTTLDPAAAVTHTYTFEVPNGKTPLILEYYYDGAVLLFSSEPYMDSEALFWKLP